MRLKVQQLTLAGHTTKVVSVDRVSEEIIGVLAWKGVRTVTVTRENESTTYGPIEYSCMVCGSYDHDDGDCSDCMKCQEYSMMAPEDRPELCEECGGKAGENA